MPVLSERHRQFGDKDAPPPLVTAPCFGKSFMYFLTKAVSVFSSGVLPQRPSRMPYLLGPEYLIAK